MRAEAGGVIIRARVVGIALYRRVALHCTVHRQRCFVVLIYSAAHDIFTRDSGLLRLTLCPKRKCKRKYLHVIIKQKYAWPCCGDIVIFRVLDTSKNMHGMNQTDAAPLIKFGHSVLLYSVPHQACGRSALMMAARACGL